MHILLSYYAERIEVEKEKEDEMEEEGTDGKKGGEQG